MGHDMTAKYWQIAKYSLAFLWLYTAVISVTLGYQQGLAILESLPMPASLRPASIYLGAGLDAALGLWLLSNRKLVLNCWLQILLITSYSIILLIFAREHFTHPFAPIIKNIPILVLVWGVMMEKNKCT